VFATEMHLCWSSCYSIGARVSTVAAAAQKIDYGIFALSSFHIQNYSCFYFIPVIIYNLCFIYIYIIKKFKKCLSMYVLKK